MRHGCLERISRKRGTAVWQFRWSETDPNGKRLYHKKIIGTVQQYADESAARLAVAGSMTIAQLCDHFEQRELSKENIWRSHATKKIYKAYLNPLPREEAVLGASNLAQIHPPCGAEGWNSEPIRLAYFPAHVLDAAAKLSEPSSR